LIVDDDPRLAALVSEYLGEAGFRVSVAPDGRSALERLARDPYDAVVLDLMLPDVDGLEVCRRLRAVVDTPVLMLTARGTPWIASSVSSWAPTTTCRSRTGPQRGRAGTVARQADRPPPRRRCPVSGGRAHGRLLRGHVALARDG
jgi:DNA-binding NarL/FixJ family response regulator